MHAHVTVPVLQHLPFFALSNQFFKNLRSTFYQATMVFDNAITKMMISIQHYTFLPMMLVARFGESSALHASILSLTCFRPFPVLQHASHLLLR